jgi:ABC-type antimicrobial peptide transport system permease subunit
MDRAMEGGIDDVGLGVLFGLEMYKYEFAGLLMHAEHLEAVHGVGPHTISVPRLKKADDIDPDTFDNGLADDIFEKIIACIRIAVPYTGRIISTRESQEVRGRALDIGISQISGASRTSVGGYTESANVYSRSGSRHASYVFRIPSANLDAFLSSLSTLGNVLSRSENAEDVTLAYVDTESRIRALKAEETALLEMLEKSENLSDLMSVRSRLTDVRYQLDSYESQLRKYDSLIDYSTVSVSVSEVERLSNIRGGVWTQIGDDFMDNVYAIADGAVAFFIWFVGSLPVLILLGGFATGGFFLYRYVRRKRNIAKKPDTK